MISKEIYDIIKVIKLKIRNKLMYKKIDTEYSLLDDKVFKIFMEDKEIAKIVIEILLNKKNFS